MYVRPLGAATDIWAAYSDRHLYFAFRRHDVQPELSKASVAKRDDSGRDDWVGVVLDPLGNRQASYECHINPSGCQMDGLTSAVNGATIDLSPDWVWQSASRVGVSGYEVETAIPLESLRNKSGERVRMGILFMRDVPHLGHGSSCQGGEWRDGEWQAQDGRLLNMKKSFFFRPAVFGDSEKKYMALRFVARGCRP